MSGFDPVDIEALQNIASPSIFQTRVQVVYQTDLKRLGVQVGPDLVDAYVLNAQWVYHVGDIVDVLELAPGRGLYVIGYVHTYLPGNWWTEGEEMLDLWTGQGAIPGFRPPIDFGGDSLWYDVIRTGDETVQSRSLIPRPKEADLSSEDYLRVVAGRPRPGPTENRDANGLPISYGTLSIMSDRFQWAEELGPAIRTLGYCVVVGTPSQDGSTLVYAAGAYINARTLPDAGTYYVEGGKCNPNQADKTTMSWTSGIFDNQATGVNITLDFLLDDAEEVAILFYLKSHQTLPDRFLEISYRQGRFVVGLERQIISGLGAYPSGGVAESEGGPTTAAWFPFIPYEVTETLPLTDEWGNPGGSHTKTWRRVNVFYRVIGSTPTLTVSWGEGQTRTYTMDFPLYNGLPLQGMYSYAGLFSGQILAPVLLNTNRYELVEPGPTTPLIGVKGEAGYHVKPANDVMDALNHGVYVFIGGGRVMYLPGYIFPANWLGSGEPITPIRPTGDHGQLAGLDDNDHTQYPTTETLAAFVVDAGLTADSIQDGETNKFVTPEQVDTWNLASGVGQRIADLSSQIVTSNTSSVLTLPSTPAGPLAEVRLNSTVLRPDKDYRLINGNQIQIDIRPLSAVSPKDVVSVKYPE